MNCSETPTPYDIYNFFLSLRESLPDDSDYTELFAILSIPKDVMPTSELLQNVLPYFRRASNPGLFTTFQVIMRNAESNPAFESTFMRVCESLDVLEKIEAALLYNKGLFEAYLQALQLDNASASHQQVMDSLQRFLNERCTPSTRLRVQKVFAEEGAADELGLSNEVLATAAFILEDDALYIKILETLQLNYRENLAWSGVVDRIKKIVLEKKPRVWSEFEAFLDDFHPSGRQDQTVYYPLPENYQQQNYYNKDFATTNISNDYAAFCEQYLDSEPDNYDDEVFVYEPQEVLNTTTTTNNTINLLEQKLAGVSLGDSTVSTNGNNKGNGKEVNGGIVEMPQQQLQQREVLGPVY
ncbi:8096_t:CDS:2 [Ambispora leptoticha]|uniref:8096_t:CDS:1 n=1 Tax=Ambispora leptoticha TaxID=144679 RepID=A0A9N8VBV9_9GLOM|nr:8096_t:CDS:2 [Ambispora leptoticha]